MEHSDAVALMASEKYLLEELPTELCQEFEAHFFDCAECAFDLRAGSALIEHSKIALTNPVVAQEAVRAAARPVGWFGWLRPSIAVPVFGMLLLAVAYLNFFPLAKNRSATRGLELPELLPSASLVSVRSDRIPRVSLEPGQSFLLYVDIPAESRFASYVCELQSPAGAQVWSLPVSAEAAKDTLHLHVPAAQLPGGTYNLVVEGIPSGPSQTKVALAHYPFELTQK